MPTGETKNPETQLEGAQILEQVAEVARLAEKNPDDHSLNNTTCKPFESQEQLRLYFELQQTEMESFVGLLTHQFEKQTAEALALLENGMKSQVESLQMQVDKISRSLEEQREILSSIESSQADASPSSSSLLHVELAESVQGQLDQLYEQLESRMTEIQHSMARTPAQIDHATDSINNDPSAEQPANESADADSDPGSHWERQKAAMLSKYGIDPEHRPDNSATPQTPLSSLSSSNDRTPSRHKGHDQQPQTESAPPVDSAAIQKLKEELNAKLRDAEIEISIERAKLSQQQADLEERMVEVERREKSLSRNSSEAQESAKGMLNRMARHLGMSKQDDE